MYKRQAQTVAARGTCLRRNFGAIIVKNDEIISTGSVSYTHLDVYKRQDQLVVVGSPVYGGVMPLLVREYLAQYVTGEKTACILAAVYGNRN